MGKVAVGTVYFCTVGVVNIPSPEGGYHSCDSLSKCSRLPKSHMYS